MREMKVEHVLLFLIGAFLVYHMMGKCRRVEGITCGHPDPCCATGSEAQSLNSCSDARDLIDCARSYATGNTADGKGEECMWQTPKGWKPSFDLKNPDDRPDPKTFPGKCISNRTCTIIPH